MTSELNVSPSFVPAPSPHHTPRGARQAKRLRERARVEAAELKQPSLKTDRVSPVFALLRAYREHGELDQIVDTTESPLVSYLAALEAEVVELETWAASRGKRAHNDGAAIRQALAFLRTFGRIMSLDFGLIPIEERDRLVAMLALEHRWCYAAAGTTRDAFKVAIGRTGAR